MTQQNNQPKLQNPCPICGNKTITETGYDIYCSGDCQTSSLTDTKLIRFQHPEPARIIKCAEWCERQFKLGLKFDADAFTPNFITEQGDYITFGIVDFFRSDDGKGWLSQTWETSGGSYDCPPTTDEVELVTQPLTPEMVVFETVKLLIADRFAGYICAETESAQNLWEEIPF